MKKHPWMMGLVCSFLFASTTIAASKKATFVEDELIVKFNRDISGASSFDLFGANSLSAIQIVEPLIPEMNLYLVKVAPSRGMQLQTAAAALASNPNVSYVQPNHHVQRRIETIPNDADFSKQWNMKSENSADINATEAWKIGTGGKDALGNELVVAVVDGGVDVNHKDLAENIWKNKGEIPDNGIDDDENGYVDDVNGWNAYNGNGDIPADSHGTHVAGIIGARGNNQVQVTGVNWDVKVMAVAGASANTATVAKAYGYVMKQKRLWLETQGKKGANIVSTNSSFGVDYGDCSSASYKVWNDMYNEMGALGILSAAATANLGIDVDSKGDVPTACDSEFIIAVTNTTSENAKYSSAAWGKIHVDLGAPGTKIVSTIPGNSTAAYTGTSMATPHVAGAVAFLYSVANENFAAFTMEHPSEAALKIKDGMLATVDPVESLKDVTVSGGKLNLFKAAVTFRDIQ